MERLLFPRWIAGFGGSARASLGTTVVSRKKEGFPWYRNGFTQGTAWFPGPWGAGDAGFRGVFVGFLL